MKIAIFGIYPPPYGGISIHIRRCIRLLTSKGDEVVVYNQGSYHNDRERIYSSSLKKMLYTLLCNNFDILHFHNSNRNLKFIFVLMKVFRNKVVLTSHGDSLIDQLNQANCIAKWWMITNLKFIDNIICVNPKTVEILKSLGIRKVQAIPSYINPVECPSDTAAISKDVWGFIDSADFLICANGAIRFYNDTDLYGLDLLIDCMLDYRGSKVKLIFCVLSVDTQNKQEKKYYQHLKEVITKNDLSNNIFLYEVENTEFYPILKSSHLFIRPTNTDGYGVSIAEAIYYNIPSISTNVCQRPEGTLLIKSRCLESLKNKVQYVINNYAEEKYNVENINIPDYFEIIYQSYQEILENK